ncbi:MAG: RNA polymerase sigma factor [Prevotellaceae bacterium]|nr:RNA polymerase sigma factor [Prevotellaceae bacterium]
MNGERFKREYLPLHPKLYRIALALVGSREDAEDLLQETYCKLWDKRDALPQVLNAEAFAVTILKHLCLDRLRAPRSRSGEAITDRLTPVHDHRSPEQTMVETDALHFVRQIIEALPEKQKQVIKLRELGDCSMDEIVEITGFTHTNVRTLLSRARRTIKEQYQKVNKQA